MSEQSFIPDNLTLTRELQQWLSNQGEDVFTWVECHGLISAMALLPVEVENWQQACCAEGDAIPDDIKVHMEHLRQRYASRMGSGETLILPCRLDPYEEREGEDLAAWCVGFMAGVYLDEPLWFGDEEENDSGMAEKLLPIVLIAGLDEDETLDELWQDQKLTRQMAFAIPEILQQVFLDFNAPESGPAESD